MDQLFYFVVLIFSVILHEVAHGYMANWLGDPTARLQGRLTLNPLSHIDPVGTIVLPAIFMLTRSPFFIAYAKPVPYNPYNLSGKYDELLVAGAGPATNALLAIIFAVVIRVMHLPADAPLLSAFATIVLINIWLTIFNLIPIPPLDGSKVLSGLLPYSLGKEYDKFRHMLERMGMLGGIFIIMFLFYFVLAPFLTSLLSFLFQLLTGVAI